MQLIPRYLVNDKTNLVANVTTGTTTELRQVYQKNLKIFKGIDNVLTFEIKNNDSKPISILNTYTPHFTAFDHSKTQVLTKTGTIKETSTPNYKGQFTVSITANDLLNLDDQFLTYTIYLTKDSDNSEVITYANTHFEMTGTIELQGEAFPGPKDTYSVSAFTEIENSDPVAYKSEQIPAEAARNGNEALHTAAIYSTDFTGTVTIQGSLENQNPTNWVDITSVSLTNPTEPTPVNFNGVFSYLRTKYTTSNSGTIDKVLVRN
jgi:hypothetical protein